MVHERSAKIAQNTYLNSLDVNGMAESFNEASLDLGEGIHPFPVVTTEGVDDPVAEICIEY